MLLGTTLNALAQGQLTVTGTVTDAKGEPLVGVNVTVKDNSNLGAITNVDGKYTIKAKEYQTLVFSYIGFSNVEVILKGSKNTYNIKMTEEKVNAVDEVVITGMGTRKKIDFDRCCHKCKC